MAKKGILLINIGSPISYETKDVAIYLRQFLMDKDIINIPFLLRWILVNIGIVPRRASYSAANYKKVWTEKGSPLTVHTEDFSKKLQTVLGSDFIVRTGMRYSKTSIENALHNFSTDNVDEILVVPLYPQYAKATTGSSLLEVKRLIKKLKINIPWKTVPPFYAAESFIHSTVRIANKYFGSDPIDHFLFSFHGLPERQLRQVAGCLESADCCVMQKSCDKNCYRAHCFATAHAIALKMNLDRSQWSISFQSRVGVEKWTQPSTDSVLETLAKTGKKNIAIFCPSFVADCIETLEEIAMVGKEIFLKHGGLNCQVIPCLNSDDEWVKDFSQLLK